MVCQAIDAKVARETIEPIPIHIMHIIEPVSFSRGQQVRVTERIRDIPAKTIVFIDGMSTPKGKYKVIFRSRRYWVNDSLLEKV